MPVGTGVVHSTVLCYCQSQFRSNTAYSMDFAWKLCSLNMGLKAHKVPILLLDLAHSGLCCFCEAPPTGSSWQ